MMNKLSIGLNTTKTTQPKKPSTTLKQRASAFQHDSDSEQDASVPSKSKAKKPHGAKFSIPNAGIGKSSTISTLDVDPSIYDYDAAWDDIKRVEIQKQEASVEDATQRKPKYMGNLLAAAEVRKRDQLRAKERLLQKEREEEGEEFADKEKFVTGAYKEQQAEMQRLEDEERKKEEKLAKTSQGMSTFYRNMLDSSEKQHADLMVSTTNTPARGKEDEEGKDKAKAVEDPKSDFEIAREINEQRAGTIAVNEEGQVVDKRQLLTAGLNVSRKSNMVKVDPTVKLRDSDGPRNPTFNKQASRQRQSQVIAQQLEEAQKRVVSEFDANTASLEREAKVRKTTDGDVMSARERYLKRKQEAANK